jgi:hypothetical protein
LVLETYNHMETRVDEPASSASAYLMVPLSPRMTGLPMTVWVSPRGNARHEVRITVNMAHGNQMNIDNTAVVALRPSPRILSGRLSPEDERAVADWITRNFDTLVSYWNGDIDTVQLAQALQPLAA